LPETRARALQRRTRTRLAGDEDEGVAARTGETRTRTRLARPKTRTRALPRTCSEDEVEGSWIELRAREPPRAQEPRTRASHACLSQG
jgi:hypothetical protein